MGWLCSITDSMDLNLSKLQEIVDWSTEDGLHSMKSQTAGHDLVTEQ